jgi:hypothetical protein
MEQAAHEEKRVMPGSVKRDRAIPAMAEPLRTAKLLAVLVLLKNDLLLSMISVCGLCTIADDIGADALATASIVNSRKDPQEAERKS